ncbi:MAG: Ribosomal RNA large subunit methyltransferase E [Legionellaceae bacterium]
MSHSKSSQRWLKEHFSDRYVKLAQKEGYRSRAAYKLLAIQEKDRLLKPGLNIVDLGAAPGGWSQIVKKWVAPTGRVFALDILPMDPIPQVEFIQGDFQSENVLNTLMGLINNTGIDIILSDMAPNMSGNYSIDQPKAMYLAELALEFVNKVLKVEGTFIIKIFQGVGFDEYLKVLRTQFKQVVIRKPDASRSRSREVYLVAKGFKKKS